MDKDAYSNTVDTEERVASYCDDGAQYFLEGLGERDGEKKPELFMKAARCFESARLERLSFWSWFYCARSLDSRLGELPTHHELSELDLFSAPQPYGITDDRWESPEPSTYTEHLERDASKEERDRHRRAWAYDFAARAASRMHNHSSAATRYEQAARSWLKCVTFPDHLRIAAKFFTYSICEATRDIGFNNFDHTFQVIERCFEELVHIVKKDLMTRGALEPSNREEAQNARQNQAKRYGTYEVYLHSIAVHVGGAGVRGIALRALQMESKCRRMRLKYERHLIQWTADMFLHLTTRNGTDWKPLFLWIFTMAVIFFPLCYWGIGDIDGGATIHGVTRIAHGEQLKETQEVTTNALDLVYFSVVTLTTLGYGDLQPIGWARFVAMCEAMTGYLLLGLSLWLLTRRMSN